MLSLIRYHSFKSIDLKGRVAFKLTVGIVGSLAALAWYPPAILFLSFGLYVFSGPVLTLQQIHKMKRQRRRHVVIHGRG